MVSEPAYRQAGTTNYNEVYLKILQMLSSPGYWGLSTQGGFRDYSTLL